MLTTASLYVFKGNLTIFFLRKVGIGELNTPHWQNSFPKPVNSQIEF